MVLERVSHPGEENELDKNGDASLDNSADSNAKCSPDETIDEETNSIDEVHGNSGVNEPFEGINETHSLTIGVILLLSPVWPVNLNVFNIAVSSDDLSKSDDDQQDKTTEST